MPKIPQRRQAHPSQGTDHRNSLLDCVAVPNAISWTCRILPVGQQPVQTQPPEVGDGTIARENTGIETEDISQAGVREIRSHTPRRQADLPWAASHRRAAGEEAIGSSVGWYSPEKKL